MQATLTRLDVTTDPDATSNVTTYSRDYEDGETGSWEGADVSLVEDPQDASNKVLQLSNFAGAYARETSADALADGTLSMRVMAVSDAPEMQGVGFVYRAENNTGEANLLLEENGWKLTNKGSHSGQTAYPLLNKEGIPAGEWVDVKVAFRGAQAEISVNGLRYGKVSIEGQSTNAGTFGLYGLTDTTVLIDDVCFTNKMLAMGDQYTPPKDPDEGHIAVYEDYASDTPDWTAGVHESDALAVTLPASGLSVNNNSVMASLGNAVNMYTIRTDANGSFGVVFRYTSDSDYNAVYSVKAGEYRIKSVASGLDKVIATDSAVLKPNTKYEIVVVSTGKQYQLFINAALLAEGEESGLSSASGPLGVYNPTQNESTLLVYESSMREIWYYANDFEDPSRIGNWKGGANSSAAHVTDGTLNGNGELQISLGKHQNLINTDLPLLSNGSYEFDLMIQKSADPVYSGCLGFLFRAQEAGGYQSLYYENNAGASSWWWLAQGYGQVSSEYKLTEEQKLHVKLDVNGSNARVFVDGVLYAEMTHEQFDSAVKGYFGFRQQYFANGIRIDNLTACEKFDIRFADREEVPVTIKSDEMTVTMDEAFPRVIFYEKNQKTLLGNQQRSYSVKVNGSEYYPVISCEKTGESQLSYRMQFPSLGVTLKMAYEVSGSELRMDITDVNETGGILVQTVEFENHQLVSTTPGDSSATSAAVRNPGGWYEISDHIFNDLSTVPETEKGQVYRSYGMISSNGLAATINNSGLETYQRLNASITTTKKGNVAALGDGLLTIRTPLDVQENTIRYPWSEVLLCEDYNQDGGVTWQDAAANHKSIRTEVKGMDTMKNNMMWIAMNFASQAQTPFTSSLDLGKTIYNYTDGFGQMVMHKGYAAEGHDDSHADYGGHVNERAGGAEGFNFAIEEGKKYNMDFGIHINVSEHIPDALSFNENVMFRPLSANWGWIDQAYWVNEKLDILSGNRKQNLQKLKNEIPDLAFVYVDIYSNSTWMANDLVNNLNSLGFIAGTEFGGAMEQGAAFTHWGRDNSYPNKGNTSEILRYFKNDLDVFTTDALFNSSMMPRVATWSNKNNINEASEDFFNHNLPRKYMQHFDVLDVEENYVTFADGVRSEKIGSGDSGDNNMVTLTKNGRKIAEWEWWNLTQTVNTEAKSKTGDAVVFIPWYADDSTEKNPDEAAKIYHWNAKGGSTTWDVPENWQSISSADVYQLSGDNKVKVATVSIENGKITLDAQAKTGYVLYPNGSPAPYVAGEFGIGTPLENPNFDATNLSGWTVEANGSASAKVVQKQDTWEPYLEMTGENHSSVSISQTMKNLTPGKRNTAYFFAELGSGAELEATVEVDGKIYRQTAQPTEMGHYSLSKMWGTEYQKVRVSFDVPAGVTTAKLTVKASMKQDGALVKLDEFRVWTNPSITPNSSDAGYENYILNEDFENVEQGYGVFAHAYSSSQYTHLAEYREEAGQFTNYVIDGNFSLKTNEFDRVGETLRTIPSEVRFEKNTEYEIGFTYETGIAGTYSLAVKRPDGTIVYQHDFESTELNKDGKTINAKFTTGDYDDCYVVISQLQSTELADPPAVLPEGSRMEFRYMSLDNVSVKKTAAISSLTAATAYTNCGTAPVLPETVTAVYSDGAEKSVAVVWDQISEESYRKAGSFVVNGTVQGTSLKAVCTVTVINRSTLEIVLALADAHVANGDVDKLIPSAKEAYHKALNAARNVYEKPDASQEQVDNAWKLLMNVIHALSFVPGDATELTRLVVEAGAIDLSGYYDGAEKDAFRTALEEAVSLLADPDAMQADFDAAYNKLEEARDNLLPLPEPGDKSELEKVIGEAEALDLNKYVDDAAAKKAFADALQLANEVFGNDRASQDEIDTAKSGLLTAMGGLRLRADKSSLNEWIERLKNIDLTQYTQDSANVLRSVLAKAEALASQDLDEESIPFIQAMIVELELAEAGLVLATVEPEPEEPDTSSGADANASEKPSDNSPTTGDNFPALALSVLAVTAAGAFVFLKKRKS